MQQLLILIIFFLISSSGFGQYRRSHLDWKGHIARKNEERNAKKLQQQISKTLREYQKTSAITRVERNSKTRLDFNLFNSATINYLEYRDICDSYLNPFKKSKCTNKFNYLKEAHLQILELMKVSTTSQINQGVKEQIGEKYTSITNTVLKELEQMKSDNDKNKFYRKLLLLKK